MNAIRVGFEHETSQDSIMIFFYAADVTYQFNIYSSSSRKFMLLKRVGASSSVLWTI